MLKHVYPELAKQNSWNLPVWYYIVNSESTSELAETKAPKAYSEIVSASSISRNRTAVNGRSAWNIWQSEKKNLFKAIRLLGNLPQESINVDQYQQILEELFSENSNILSSLDSNNRSSLNRMIRIYDFLRYGQKKTP